MAGNANTKTQLGEMLFQKKKNFHFLISRFILSKIIPNHYHIWNIFNKNLWKPFYFLMM